MPIPRLLRGTGPNYLAVRRFICTQTHTHRQTHRRTDTLGFIATYSVKWTEYKQDRSSQCHNIQLTIYFYFFTGNICLIDKILSNSLSTGPKWWKQTLYLPNSMEIQKFVFWREFCHFFENAVSHNFQSYQPILLIFNSKQGVEFFFPVLKFEDNRSKIATVRVPQPKTAAMTS